MKKIMSGILSRVFVLYIIAFLLLYFVFDLRAVLLKTRLNVLNRLRPETVDHLIPPANDQEKFNRKKWEQSAMYYENVVELMPDRADALGMLAYCSYYLGKKDQAAAYYARAARNIPVFFWYPYNLGVIYLESGRYKEAGEQFKAALTKSPELTLKFVQSSIRIYMPVVAARSGDIERFLKSQIKEGYRRAYLGLIISLERTKNYDEMLGASVRAVQSAVDESGVFYYYAGAAAYGLKNYEQAIYFFQEALKRDGNLKEAYDTLSLTLKAIGKGPIAELIERKRDALMNPTVLLNEKDFQLESY